MSTQGRTQGFSLICSRGWCYALRSSQLDKPRGLKVTHEAKELGVVKTIAEVENLQFISEAEGLNIGTIINKKLLASSRIFQMLLDRDTSTSKCLALADAEVAEIVAREGSKITRGQVKDLRLSRDMTIAGLIRDGKGQLVSGNTVIAPGDRVVVFTLNGLLHKVEKLFK